MAILKCKMCGGDLKVEEGINVCECEYCGSKQTVPNVDNEKKITLFTRANRLRTSCEFDKAFGVYESIVSEFPEEAEAYWGLILCKYGIEYVDDPAIGKKIPTCHRSSFESIFEDSDFEMVMEYADAASRSVYRSEAKVIEELRTSILEVSSKEEPYDIFICYKETDENGDRTIDSVLAQDVYDALTEKRYKVFFSRITLEDKIGSAYEPYIFAALNSAKVMVVLGTKPEYFNAVWTKNEWSRYLALIKSGEKKILVPAYRDMDPYDLPEEFSHLQAQDMSKLGFMQDLIRGIKKMLQDGSAMKEVVSETVVVHENASVAPLLKRAFMFLEDGHWESADEYCERVLDMDPENAEAYLGKLMSQLKVKRRELLGKCKESFEPLGIYKKIMRFADSQLKEELQKYNDEVEKRIREEQLEKQYNCITSAMQRSLTEAEYRDLATQLTTMGNYKNAVELKKECLSKAELEHKLQIENEEKKSSRKKKNKKILFGSLAACVPLVIIFICLFFSEKEKDSISLGEDISMITNTPTKTIEHMATPALTNTPTLFASSTQSLEQFNATEEIRPATDDTGMRLTEAIVDYLSDYYMTEEFQIENVYCYYKEGVADVDFFVYASFDVLYNNSKIPVPTLKEYLVSFDGENVMVDTLSENKDIMKALQLSRASDSVSKLYIKELIRRYMHAKLALDEELLTSMVTDSSYLNMETICIAAEHAEEYRNFSYLIYSGPDDVTEFDYCVYVAYNCKILNIDTLAPGMDEFLISVDENNYPYIFLGALSSKGENYRMKIRASEEYKIFQETKVTQPLVDAMLSDADLYRYIESLSKGEINN